MLRVLYYQNSDLCLEIEIEEETINRISFCELPLNNLVEDAFEKEVIRQLDAYFAGESQEFDLPFFATGTPFQLMVWEELLRIPYGQTISYREMAELIGKPKAARAVGNALGANPISILIPCHRVISSDGTLGGFGGGLPVKTYLLALEKRNRENS
ncbi:MAG: methylated-DNA--[protein]-cysteine S-methyltransferase [Candidatus Cloacimonetes bacterium]|nr:methylated-DNA--[protein]-cysteine S-methyltransferase [Candidatus Cloacimonadota bacterium]MDD2423275.1 methylated-DNA--[protein]-cysteine S-methyltransferase [Candidatus Cloacimonadota bacterium]MDD3562787.1 methylated-DNA--[protein]-cysteine S-methyltransferase [Candidatus Cloacimonadota bacterium]MDD4277640.1 methylated-DNA--[protein]-cysteine S-methyltransferase [Candidatus Cloacimonadota bacterium]MDY0325526.1 methylated-DNA--[protein]-cysteine S-methyltransferase [Candidatus Cloacimon